MRFWMFDRTRILIAVSFVSTWLLGTPVAVAHCDALDGPVVSAARSALEKGDVAAVLMWVPENHEREVREVFDRTMSVREQGSDARQLADAYFFETLVRLHRAGEGEPFTGLKPAGIDPGPAVRASDRALETASADRLLDMMTKEITSGIRERFHRAMELKRHAEESVEAGRNYVQAYVEFVHYVESLHQVTAGTRPAHPQDDGAGVHQ